MRKYPFEIYIFMAMAAISLFLIMVAFLQGPVLNRVYLDNFYIYILLIIGFLLGISSWVYSLVNKGYKTSTTAVDYKSSHRIIFIIFAFASSFIAFVFIAGSIGRYYEIPFFACLLPTYFFEILISRKDHDTERAYIKKHGITSGIAVAFFAVLVALDVTNYLYLWDGALLILGMCILLPTREIRKENEIKSLTFRLLSPFAALSLIFFAFMFYRKTISSGPGFFYAVVVIFAILLFIVLRNRYRSYYSNIITATLVLLSLYAFYQIALVYRTPLIWTFLLLIFTFWIFGYNYRTFREGSRNIYTAFDLMSRGRYILSIVAVIAFGGIIYGNISAIQHDFGLLYSAGASISSPVTIHNPAGLMELPEYIGLAGMGLIFMVSIGYRKFNIFLFIILLLAFFTGISYFLSTKITSVWTPNSVEVLFLSIIITALVFYEPTYRFVRSYTSRIPVGLSLGRQRGSARFLHGRYDVSLVPSKKNNPDVLGAGGFAYVFRGKDVLKNVPVVLKVPRIYDEESKSDLEKRESIKESIKQLEAESRVLSEISFPGVVSYVEYFREGGQHFLVEEYAEGRNLNSYLATKGKEGTKFEEDEVIRISLNLLFSVNYLHLHEIFHRDLNPGNIVITKKIPKIIDFGTSKHLASRVSGSFFTHSERIGVPCYHPPELDSDDKIKASSTYDTYSIGALMCSMITGKFLDNEEMREKYGVEFITRKYLETEVKPLCNPKIFDIITKATNLKPSERYKSAFHFIADFLTLSGDFLVTDLGYICKLDQDHKIQIFSQKAVPASILGDYIVNDYNLYITEKGKDDRSRVGTVEYDNRTNTFVVYPYGKRNIFQKKSGSLSQKVIRGTINEGDIISIRPDLREGTFSYYRVRV